MQIPQTKLIHIDGQTIHYKELGNPNRQLALLIHGWSSSWYALSPLLGPLSQRFHCVAVDLPGYGQSPPLDERASIPRYAELMSRLCEELSDGPVVLVGHSMGGMTSITMALRYPALVERMVLLGPTITGVLSTSINLLIAPITMLERFGLGSLIVSSVERAMVGITDRLMRPVSFSERSGITEQDYHRLRADARRPGQGRVRAECFFAMRENNLSGQLSRLEVPTLIIWGAEDNTVPLRDASIVADEWPDADLRILPKAGHWPQFETPEQTRRLVASFLGLPLLSDQLSTPVSDDDLYRVREIAQFLTHSDLGRGMTRAQRSRLAAQFRQYHFKAGEAIVSAHEAGNEMYLIQEGTVEVWSDPKRPGSTTTSPERMAVLTPGQMTGELAMLDQETRTADLIAGTDGAVVLGLSRDRLLALIEDDPDLGAHLLWNIAKAMSSRVRYILWQLQRAQQRVRHDFLQ
ncbi:MAG: alpha/beta fold hydrolase [Anaerolineae bacterium]|nr:MAG: alpha/beta fold hydrolase [Anaerolineae bacterium]